MTMVSVSVVVTVIGKLLKKNSSELRLLELSKVFKFLMNFSTKRTFSKANHAYNAEMGESRFHENFAKIFIYAKTIARRFWRV